jgi:hypothetical protein
MIRECCFFSTAHGQTTPESGKARRIAQIAFDPFVTLSLMLPLLVFYQCRRKDKRLADG